MTPEQTKEFNTYLANVICNDTRALMDKHQLTIETFPIAPETVGFLCHGFVLKLWDKKFVKTTIERWVAL